MQFTLFILLILLILFTLFTLLTLFTLFIFIRRPLHQRSKRRDRRPASPLRREEDLDSRAGCGRWAIRTLRARSGRRRSRPARPEFDSPDRCVERNRSSRQKLSRELQ